MRTLLLIFIISLQFGLYAQRIKYKELFPILQSAEEEQKLQLIKEYLLTEPEHPNANFLLTNIYNKRYKEFDVLTQYDIAMANAEQAKLRVLKCRSLLDQKELRRRDEYYLKPDGSSYSYEEIMAYLQSTYDEADQFMKVNPPIYDSFTKSVTFYNRATNQYAKIISEFNSLDDLYMNYSDEIDRGLEQLKVYFDSTVFYLNKYKHHIKDNPIDHDQNYTIRSIDTYRLGGMVASIPFLKNDFVVWNYKKWANDIQNEVQKEIVPLRSQLIAHDNDISGKLKTITPPEEEVKDILDKELIYNLGKYDFQSLPVSLLKFKNYQYKLNQFQQQSIYYDTSTHIEVESKYLFYSNMINNLREADTLIDVAIQRNSIENRSKYQDYIKDVYNNEKGLEQYLSKNKSKLNSSIGQQVLKLKNINTAEISSDEKEEILISYKDWKIADLPNLPSDSSAMNGTFTIDHAEMADGSQFLIGFRSNEGVLTSFVLKHSNGNVIWFQEVETPEEADKFVPSKLSIKREGLVLAGNLWVGDVPSPLFLTYNENGEQGETWNLMEEGLVKDIKYDEYQNRTLVVLDQQKTGKGFKLMSLSNEGKPQWNTQLTASGVYLDFIQLASGYILFTEASSYLSYEKKEITPQKPVLLMTKYDINGAFLTANAENESRNFKDIFVSKISESNIMILNQKGNHLLVDAFLQVVHTDI